MSTKQKLTPASSSRKKIVIFFFVGVFNTLVDFVIYTIASSFLHIPLTVSTAISGSISAISTFFTHGKITWKERELTGSSMIRFATWCCIMVVAVRPIIAFVAEQLTPLYQFAFAIFSFMHLPFSYKFVANTGVFVIIAAVVMVLNFLVYEKFVFPHKSTK